MSTDTRPEILVCDDNGKRAHDWAAAIKLNREVDERYAVTELEPEAFGRLFRALARRKLHAAESADAVPDEDEVAQRLDRAAMVIVDYDLTPTNLIGDINEAWVEQLSGRFGDGFAYLVRCFSDVPYTVLVNQDFQTPTFDVTMRRFERSFADLDVTQGDIARPSLWTGPTGEKEFRPWHWPRLVDAPTHRRKLVQSIALEQPILAQLGFDLDRVFAAFHTEQIESLLSAGEEREAVLEKKCSDLAMLSDFGLHPADAKLHIPEKRLRKIAAAALTHWIERIVLPGQNVIVDAPHLASRRPGLVELDGDPEAWTRLTRLDDPAGVIGALSEEFLGENASSVERLAPFVSRPVWQWPGLPSRTPHPAKNPTWVFVEDTSRFIPADDATEVSTSVPGPYKQRYLEWLTNDHEPSLTVNRDDAAEDATGFSIDYDPITRMF